MNTVLITFIAICAALFFIVSIHLSFTLGRLYECADRIKELDRLLGEDEE